MVNEMLFNHSKFLLYTTRTVSYLCIISTHINKIYKIKFFKQEEKLCQLNELHLSLVQHTLRFKASSSV